MVDLDAMRTIAVGLYAPRIERTYGEPGIRALRALLAALHVVHQQIAYEQITDGIWILAPFDPDAEPVPRGGGVDVTAPELTARVHGAVTLQVLPNGLFRLWSAPMDDPAPVADVAIVYRFEGGDSFYLDGAFEAVPNPTGFPSAFGLPTFVDLDDALRHYADVLARHSTCHILRTCWRDELRWLLVNKPEVFMRRSLAQHLRSTLRGHQLVELREEQNVDETHPVDIKVTWSLTNRLALIEVKWMGDSLNAEGTAVATSYRDGRAREGATQLADYLDANVVNAPRHITRGYLVVFDARRRGVTMASTQGNVAAGELRHYADKEVEYDPRYELVRDDFAQPQRVYLEPSVPGPL